jgi:hypothetical protein
MNKCAELQLIKIKRKKEIEIERALLRENQHTHTGQSNKQSFLGLISISVLSNIDGLTLGFTVDGERERLSSRKIKKLKKLFSFI